MKHILDEYKTLYDQKQYIKIIIANVINRFGDSIDAIAFTWLVYELTHSASWSAIVFGVNMLPTIILQPLSGALVEGLKKKNIMVLADIARGICVAGIAILYVSGLLTPWMLLLTTLLNSTFETLRVPAGIAIVPILLDKDKYDVGVSLNASLSRVMELIGTGCAGFIIAFGGIGLAIFIDAITFIGSAAVISRIHCKEKIEKVKFEIKTYFITLKEGFHYVKCREIVWLICFIGAFLNAMLVPMNSLLPAYIDETLHNGSDMLSILSISLTIGSFIGSFLYPMIAKKFSKRALFIATNLISGIFYTSIILVPSYISLAIVNDITVIFMFACMGVISAAVSNCVSVLLAMRIDQEYMARVGAVFNASVCAAIPVGSFLITILLQFTSYPYIMMGAGIICFIALPLLLHSKRLYILDEEA